MHGIWRENYTKKIPFCSSQPNTNCVCPILRAQQYAIEPMCRKSKTYWIIYRSVSVLITLIAWREAGGRVRGSCSYSYNINRQWQAKGQCLINEWNIHDQIACASLTHTKCVEFIQNRNKYRSVHAMEKQKIRRRHKKVHGIHRIEMRNANFVAENYMLHTIHACRAKRKMWTECGTRRECVNF